MSTRHNNEKRALKLYVSPEGNDRNPGTAGKPFAAIGRARDAVRNRIAAGLDSAIIVFISGGMYELAETLVFSPEDSGTEEHSISYNAAPGERVVISGGRQITGWQPVENSSVLRRLDNAARGKVLQAELKTQGIDDFGAATPGIEWQPNKVMAGRCLELFFQDRPMKLARWPNEEFTRIADVVGGAPHQRQGRKGDKIGKIVYEGDRPERWREENDIWLHGYWFYDWADAYQKVASIDMARHVITLAEPYHLYGYRKDQRYYVLNLLAELDSPGEWYLDRKTGILYFWPPSDIQSSPTFISMLDALIRMEGAAHITMRGLTLSFNRGTAITINNGSHNTMVGCTLRNIGGNAVVVNGGTDHAVIGCDIYAMGDGGVALSGGDRNTLTSCRHAAVNNHIHHYSRINKTYHPAVRVSGVGCRVAHNLIHHAPHMAIGLSGNEHIIELNEVHAVCTETADAGAFYMGRDWTARGNIIRYNYFHHIGEFKGNFHHIDEFKRKGGGQAVYLDDFTSGTTVFGNIFREVFRAVLVGGGRNNLVANNIIINCDIGIHIDSRGLIFMKDYFDGTNNTLIERLNAVPYREPRWAQQYPELLTLYNDEPALAKYNKVLCNIVLGCGKWLRLSKYLRLDNGLSNGVVEIKDNFTDGDPGFADAAKDVFRLKEDSPVWKFGFQRIPGEKIGLYQDELCVWQSANTDA